MLIMFPAILAISQVFSLLQDKHSIPKEIQNQFFDYNLLLHCDNTTSNQLYTLLNKDWNRQEIKLINYDRKFANYEKGENYKFLHIVILKNVFRFKVFSDKPYNFYPSDTVLFVVDKIEANISKIAGLKNAQGVFVYNINKHSVLYCCYYCGKMTAVLRPTKISKMKGLLNKYNNLRGHSFKVAYTDFAPFFWKDSNEKRPQGAEGQLLQELSGMYNFRYELVKYESTLEKGAWTAMVEAVGNYTVDWAVGGLSVSIKRAMFTDFTRFIKSQGFSTMYVTNQYNSTLFTNIAQIFEKLIWVATALAVVGVSLFVRLANNNLGNTSKNNIFIKLVVISLAEQPAFKGDIRLINAFSIKFMFIVWWFCCLCLTSIYKSQMASVLVRPSSEYPKVIDHLVQKGFTFYANAEDWSVLKENLNNSRDQSFLTILRGIRDDLNFCDAVHYLKKHKAAVIDEEIPLQTCGAAADQDFILSLRLVSEDIFPTSYHAWSMTMRTPLKLPFSKTIGRMTDYGLLNYWYNNASHLKIKRSNIASKNDKAVSLSITKLFSHLLVLGIGLTLSFIVFLMEIYIK